MTIHARGFRRRIGVTSEAPPDAAVEFSLVLPEAVSGVLVAKVADEVASIARRRAAEAGVEQRIAVHTTSNPLGPIEVSLSGRPLALINGVEPDDEQWLSRVSSAVERALVRRRSLLLNDSLASMHADRLAKMTEDQRLDRYQAVPALLLDAGISLRELEKVEFQVSPRGCSVSAEIAEVFIDAYAATTLEVEVSDKLLRSTVSGEDAMRSARQDLYNRTGLQLPDVVLRWSGSNPKAIRAKFNDVRVPVTTIGPASTWPMAVNAVMRVVEQYGDWFVRMHDIDRILNQFAPVVPELVNVSSRRYSVAMLTAVLRALLANGSSIRNLPRILSILIDADLPASLPDGVPFSAADPADASAELRDPDVIASTIRRRIIEEGWMAHCIPNMQGGVSVPLEVESALRLRPGSSDRSSAEWRLVRLTSALEAPTTVVTHTPDMIAAVRYALKALPTSWHVIASQELPAALPMPPVMTEGRSAAVPLAGPSPKPGAYPLA
ncbi:MAG: hypothetical protein ABI047_12350 [Jatrophihabitantaceae bacterium]